MAGIIKFRRIASLSKLLSNQLRVTGSQYNLDCNRLLLSNSEPQTKYTRLSNYTTNVKAETKNVEKPIGVTTQYEFQAETRMLLDIVARSLYSEKEVFLRELISNANDALEKLRYNLLTDKGGDKELYEQDRKLEIHIKTDKIKRILIIQDTGIGMTADDLQKNLGIIARSGSKNFLKQLKDKTPSDKTASIIGQFGVGFYSAFMVADKVEVYSKEAHSTDGYKWSSTGSGTFELQQAEGVQYGTKIVLHLKADCREFADEETVKRAIQKYSNFLGHPIVLNDTVVNTVEPLWMKDPKSITQQMHSGFYRFISNSFDSPRFILHYHTDVPLSIHALFYFPEGKPGLFEMSRDIESGISLYSKKVLIKTRADNILPKWLRFVKGVVDSEDIPLNLSRELLQNSVLINKIKGVLTNKILKFLHEQTKKAPEEYNKFYAEYGLFLKEGIITNHDHMEREEIAKLLRFESSQKKPNEKVGIEEYITRTKPNQRSIYYLAAPSRTLAESSPYYEALQQKAQEVLFCYEPYDELVLMQLQNFRDYRLVSVEKDMREDKQAKDITLLGSESLQTAEINDLIGWLKKQLKGKAHDVTTTNRLKNHPCVITVEEMGAARHFIRTQSHQLNDKRRYELLQPQLEINPNHPIIKQLYKLKDTDSEISELLANQLFDNAMVGAGLVDDPRALLTSINDLLIKLLEKE